MSEHTNERTETHACDSISRQKAINTVKKMRAVCDTDSIEDYEALLETAFEALPSAQPKTQLSAEDTTFDCISRQAAINALLGITAMRNTIPLDSAIFNIKKLPSAQPEIVRCKDCKHYAGDGMYCAWDIMVHYEHFYCYHAERGTDE